MRRIVSLLSAALLLSSASFASASELAKGRSRQDAFVSGMTIPVAFYRTKGCRARVLLFVFAGMKRNYETYRDDAEPLAQEVCGIVIAPRFDQAAFPSWRYQRGGVPLRDGRVPAISLVAPLIAWSRTVTGLEDTPVVLIGHSAGAQFLERVAAYAQPQVAGVVVMNPSTYVLPSTKVEIPYGFGGPNYSDDLLKRYISFPVTILIGKDDVTDSHDMVRTPQAMAQGNNRRERGERTFRMAQTIASVMRIPFGWRLGIVPDTGHDGRRMLASSQLEEAVEAAVSRASSR